MSELCSEQIYALSITGRKVKMKMRKRAVRIYTFTNIIVVVILSHTDLESHTLTHTVYFFGVAFYGGASHQSTISFHTLSLFISLYISRPFKLK